MLSTLIIIKTRTLKKYLLVVASLFLGVFAFAQDDFFLVELEMRTPEVEDMVKAFEGTSVVPIMAADLDGNQVSVLDQRDKVVLLWFWKLDCDECIQKIPILNQIQQEFPNLKIISYASDSKADVQAFAQTMDINFTVIPNALMIAEGPYSGDLGYPKMFFVDKKQIIKWVFPAKDFLSPKFDLYRIVKTLYMQLEG